MEGTPALSDPASRISASNCWKIPPDEQGMSHGIHGHHGKHDTHGAYVVWHTCQPCQPWQTCYAWRAGRFCLTSEVCAWYTRYDACLMCMSYVLRTGFVRASYLLHADTIRAPCLLHTCSIWVGGWVGGCGGCRWLGGCGGEIVVDGRG